MADDVPDMKSLLVKLLAEASVMWPELVDPGCSLRVEASTDAFTVGMRVLASVMLKAGMPRARLEELVASCRVLKPDEAVPSGTPERSEVVPDVYRLLWSIDRLLSDPSKVSSVPAWFKDDFWPGVLRRVAGGSQLTAREAGIALNILESCGGRRE